MIHCLKGFGESELNIAYIFYPGSMCRVDPAIYTLYPSTAGLAVPASVKVCTFEDQRSAKTKVIKTWESLLGGHILHKLYAVNLDHIPYLRLKMFKKKQNIKS